MPMVAQRTVEAVTGEVTHTHPGKMGRAYLPSVQFGVGGTVQSLEHIAVDGFGADKHKGHVDAVKSHPSDFLVPTVLVPIGHGVAVSHDIEVLMVAIRRGYRLGGCGGAGRSLEAVGAPGTDTCSVALGEVIEATAGGHAVRRCNVERRTAQRIGELVLAIVLEVRINGDVHRQARVLTHEVADDFLCGCLLCVGRSLSPCSGYH